MKISDLVKALEGHRDVHGDMDVLAYDQHSGPGDILAVSVEEAAWNGGQLYVQIRFDQ